LFRAAVARRDRHFLKVFTTMTNPDPKKKGQKPPQSPADAENDKPLQPAGEVVVQQQDEAAPAPPGKTIHRRSPLPPVPDKGADSATKDRE
jgi:hypothetical protein